jgi:hypothetical protein
MSATKRFITGVYDDDEVTIAAVRKVRAAGVKVHEVYSPFPIHGIDDALGYKRSRLPIAAFMFGATGTTCAVLLQTLTLGFDWRMNIGGKPHIATPDFIPISFEGTVLCAALGMVGTFLIASKLGPGSQKMVLDARASDDKFILAIDLDKNSGMSVEQITELLKSAGASEVNQKEVSE